MSHGLVDANGRPLGPSGPKGDFGANRDAAVADVSMKPPSEWEAALRRISPQSDLHSWLFFYYYRAKDRWTLYDGVPLKLIDPDQPQAPGLMGFELLDALRGDRPSDRVQSQRTMFVSDTQHEMARVYGVYARPFWVLQGDTGGHQIRFSPEQKQFLTEIGAPTDPPAIGALPACPFDGRVEGQLRRLNRLLQLNGSMQELRNSASGEAADRRLEAEQREIRDIALQMLEQQLAELSDRVRVAGHRKDTHDMVIDATGQAAKAKDALDVYRETGQYVM